MVNWGSLVGSRGRLVRSWGRLVWSWSRCIYNRSRLVGSWGGLVRSWGRCIHNRGRLVWSWGRFVGSWGRDNLNNRGRLVRSWGSDNLDNRSRGRLVWGWGRLISWGWGRFVRSSLGIDSLTLVLHISNIALRTSSVCDNLDTAIRKVDSVLPSSVVVSAVLLLGENSSRVFWVVDSILVVVDRRQVWVCFRGGVGGRGASGRGYSNKCGKKYLGSHGWVYAGG